MKPIKNIRPASLPESRPRKQQIPGEYTSTAWRKATAAWLMYHPICSLCLVRGDVNSGAARDTCTSQRLLVVDHIEPHHGNDQLYWSQDNWQTLCRYPCHDVDKKRHEKAGKGATQWFEYLRAEMRQHASQAIVMQMMGFLPPHVADELRKELPLP